MSTLESTVRRRLDELPRAPLGVCLSPVQAWSLDVGTLWVKRDDLNAAEMGGNNARALQYLLGAVPSGSSVLTVGGIGSTHVLATILGARRAGLQAYACRWPHELNATAERVAGAIVATGAPAPLFASPLRAWIAAGWRRVRHGDWWVPFGGTSSLGMLGHVEGALELAGQVNRGELPEPAKVVLPFGTGGTAAGMALGLVVAGLQGRVRAVRCGPTVGHERAMLRWLLHGAASLLGVEQAVATHAFDRIDMDHSMYAGAYARPHAAAAELASTIRRDHDTTLDDTYSAKACYSAVREVVASREPVLFWHTFDARWMNPHESKRDDRLDR